MDIGLLDFYNNFLYAVFFLQLMEEKCFFCDMEKVKPSIFMENGLFYARWDGMPVSKGHAEVIPKKHILSLFDLSKDELIQMHDLIMQAKDLIDKKHSPDGYNIGVNEGEAAGRTVHHLHIHIIPRYKGDVKEPRGGVRHVIPGKGNY